MKHFIDICIGVTIITLCAALSHFAKTDLHYEIELEIGFVGGCIYRLLATWKSKGG
jgi:hypothetical protein